MPEIDPDSIEPIEEMQEDTPGPERESPEPLPEAPLTAILEALLFASEEPVTPEEMRAILGKERSEEIEMALDRLTTDYLSSSRGLRVQAIAGGYRIATDPNLGPFVRELVRNRNRQKLSRAALETLAIVAYKQPITGPEVQEIRGVNPSAILGALLDRRLVRILGRKKVVGKPFLYGTTRDFLVRFGLNSLQDLPSMEEFDAMIQERASLEPVEPASSPMDDEPQPGLIGGAGAEPGEAVPASDGP